MIDHTTMTVATKSRPIIMSADSVRALLDGRKTQTRRVVKPFKLTGKKMGEVVRVWALPNDPCGFACRYVYGKPPRSEGYAESPIRCPYGVPGDLLWCRESWAAQPCYDNLKPNEIPDSAARTNLLYDCGPGQRIVEGFHRRRRARHMPRYAARLWLLITDVRAQQVQDISEADARAEGMKERLRPMSGLACAIVGVRTNDPKTYRETFRRTWDSLNAKRGYSWDSNPYVWVVEFEQTVNVDAKQSEVTRD